MTGWSKGVGDRVVTGFLANALTQGGNIGLQLASVPLFFSYWGNAVYGAWLVCFTLPAILSFGDLGLSTSAGNAMIPFVATGRPAEAVRFFQSVALAILCIAVLIISIVVAVVCLFPGILISIEGHSVSQVAAVVVLLTGYSVVSQYTGLLGVGFRSDGHYALGSVLAFAISASEYLAVMAVLVLGGKCVAVAATFLLFRTLGSLLMSLILARRVPWLRQGFREAKTATLRGLARQSVAVMVLPIAQTATLQGTVLLLGSLLSPAAVATFVTVRTATRVGFQGVFLLNHAVMPEIAAVGTGENVDRRSQLVVANFFGIAIALAPTAVILVTFGPLLIKAWTHGHVTPDRSLVVGLVAVMIVNGVWHPTSNLLLALNRQGRFAFIYLALSLVSLLLGYVLIGHFGIGGAVAATFALDMAMLICILYLVFYQEELGNIDVYAGYSSLMATATNRLHLLSGTLLRRQSAADGV